MAILVAAFWSRSLCFAWKEGKKDKCTLCDEAGFYSEDGSDAEPTIQFINSYWDHLKQAKEALENDIITQEDYDDLKAHFLKKLKEM